MSEWKKTLLGHVATFQRGYDLPHSRMVDGPYPVMGSNGIIGWHNEFTTKAPCVSVGRSGTIGRPHLLKQDCWEHNTSLYVKDFKGNDPLFVYYLLFTLHLDQYGAGSAVPTLNRNHIHSLEVRIPSVATQKKIAAVLSSLDDKIENNRKICKTLEEQAQAIFKSWFVDFEPFGGEMLSDDIWGRHPSDLSYVSVASLSPILETGSRPKGGAVASGVPSIGAENVKHLGEFDFAARKFIPEEYAMQLKRGRINGYELLLYKDGGKPGMFKPHFSMFGEGFPYSNCFINEHVFKVDFGVRAINVFAYFYFKSQYVFHWLETNGSKAAIPGINQSNVLDVMMPDPSNPLVSRFGETVLPMFGAIFEKCKESRTLSELRDALLPKLMSGEIDVNKVEV